MKANKAIARTGFTLIELTVVIMIIGVLAAFAVPRFKASVERSKAAEAFNYLTSIQTAQERYHAKQSAYAANIADLDIQMARSSPMPNLPQWLALDVCSIALRGSLLVPKHQGSSLRQMLLCGKSEFFLLQ